MTCPSLCDCCPDDDRTCPACDGDDLYVLGVLGSITHYRCRACGMDSHHDDDPHPVYDDECYEEG